VVLIGPVYASKAYGRVPGFPNLKRDILQHQTRPWSPKRAVGRSTPEESS